MKKQTDLFFIIIIVLVGVIGFLGYLIVSSQMVVSELKNQNSNLQDTNNELKNVINQAHDKAKITQFSISGMKKPKDNTFIFESTVRLKICNTGINDIKKLNLTIVAFGAENCAKTLQLDCLQAGEEKQITTNVNWTYGAYGTSTATLKLENKTLDESYVLFSQVY